MGETPVNSKKLARLPLPQHDRGRMHSSTDTVANRNGDLKQA